MLTDTGAEYAQMKAMVDANILKPEKLLAWYFGISEEEAKATFLRRIRLILGSDEGC